MQPDTRPSTLSRQVRIVWSDHRFMITLLVLRISPSIQEGSTPYGYEYCAKISGEKWEVHEEDKVLRVSYLVVLRR